MMYRVWQHDEFGIAIAGHTDVEAESAKAAAEQVTGHPVLPYGPMHALCARVIMLGDLATHHADGFFRGRPAPDRR